MRFSSRLFRRVIITVVFLAVFFLLGYGTQQITQPVVTCTDGIMNGQEEGIDCGLISCGNYCEPDLDPPQVSLVKLIEAGDNDYDFVAVINNPHNKFGSPEIAYEMQIYNGNDEILLTREGEFYLLPNQTKYLIIPSLLTERMATRAEFKIKSARWQRLDSLEGMNFVIRNDRYTISSDGNSSNLSAVVLNDSGFDFEVVDIDIILFDNQDNIIGVNRSDIRTFSTRTERHFVATWPFRINEDVDRSEIRISTNLFDNSNFIKAYGSDIQKFQEY